MAGSRVYTAMASLSSAHGTCDEDVAAMARRLMSLLGRSGSFSRHAPGASAVRSARTVGHDMDGGVKGEVDFANELAIEDGAASVAFIAIFKVNCKITLNIG